MENIEEFKSVYSNNYDVLTEYGITTPPNVLRMEDKVKTIHSITLHHVLLRSKAEIDQFIQGFECLGTHNMLKMYPQILFQYYMFGAQGRLSAGKALGII